MPRNLVAEAKQIISENIYLTLATSNERSEPWITPLFYSYDGNFNFYWLSPKSSLHSKNIRSNSNVSIVIYDTHAIKYTGIGLYLSGNAVELNNLDDKEEVEKGISLEFTRLEEKIPSFERYLGENEYRVYKFKINKMWITDDIKDENGDDIDHRTEIHLDNEIND